MPYVQRTRAATLQAFGLACALIVAAALVLPACKPANINDPAGRQAYELTVGGSVGLSVDYQTGRIIGAKTDARVVLGLSSKDAKGVLTIDCSRLGGGSIAGGFRAYLGGTEVERGEFQCLYQHIREVVLAKPADSVRVSDLRFIRVIE